MDVNETETRIQQELIAVIGILTEMTGLTSRWSGEVELSQDPRIFGRKPFACQIVLNAQIAEHPVRWRTLIHEALHSFSAGYNMTDHQAFLGWEEGVIEQSQRLLRSTVLERLGLQIDEDVFTPIEASYSFNKYIKAIEKIRSGLLREDETAFYLDLLAVDIKLRQDFVFGIGNQLPSKEHIAFISIFSASNSILKEFV